MNRSTLYENAATYERVDIGRDQRGRLINFDTYADAARYLMEALKNELPDGPMFWRHEPQIGADRDFMRDKVTYRCYASFSRNPGSRRLKDGIAESIIKLNGSDKIDPPRADGGQR
jgi:hypothetical protein